jgi:ppGpp synthetase/RelA/SpoT-type nucleotidyltranferase
VSEALLDAFDAHLPGLEALSERLRGEFSRLLEGAGVQVQFVASRVKGRASLQRKLSSPDKTYKHLWEVTDLVGLRVATYFEDTIETIARLVEERYQVDFRHSTDKLRFTDAGRFGYRSLHYVCAVPGGPHPEFRFELQLRTVLQHAWAEVEHDLGYKAHDAVPEQIRRRFSRVASLLEIADQEFVSIRRDLLRYQETVRAELAQAGSSLPLDAVSLDTLTRDPAVRTLDVGLAEALRKPLVPELFYPRYLLQLLTLSGLKTTEDLRRALEQHGAEVPRVVAPYFAFAERTFGLQAHSLESVRRGYALFFVAHLSVLRGPELGLSKVARLTRLYAELDYDGDERQAHQVASGLLAAL